MERLRRLRRTSALRTMFTEVRLHPSQLVAPLFVSETARTPEPIASMPGQFRLPLSSLPAEVCKLQEAGVGGVLLFGLPARKDEMASAMTDPRGIVPQAVRCVKDSAQELVVFTDVCVCAAMTHGHCGVLRGQEVDNDATLPILAEMAVAHASAGADLVAPSSMMDGQVGAIRGALDSAGYVETGIMAYSSKFASAFYGPFREAADSAPSFGDRSSYQHPGANVRHAARELEADVREGADVLMVKPGMPYLDVVRLARERFELPVAVYHVSGEYAMLKAAAQNGWLAEKAAALEVLTALRRAGADLILTYYALEAANWLNDN